ncbi:MAG: hypothetical protein IH948_00045 [Bacteroidetes bacterium]|nr:hypothetical protein [Bacteroidota bacterium]
MKIYYLDIEDIENRIRDWLKTLKRKNKLSIEIERTEDSKIYDMTIREKVK